MKIGFISDTHEQTKNIAAAVERFNNMSPDLVIHLGDICSPIMADHFKPLKAPLKIIFGNNDGDKAYLRKRFDYAELFTTPHEFSLNGKKIICMHEPEFLEVFLKSGEYDLLAYGHTHRKEIRKNGSAAVLNPGEAGGLLTGISSAAMWDTSDGSIFIFDIFSGDELK